VQPIFKADLMIYTKDYLSILKKVTIFAGMEESGLRRLFSRCAKVRFSAQTRIIEEGADATEIFIILVGRVKIVIGSGDKALEVIELGPGSCIGEASVIGIQAHSASATAIENTEVLVLSRTVLMGIQKKNKDLFSLLILNIARELARRLHRTDHILLLYSKEHLRTSPQAPLQIGEGI
jgi:CRP/FNR family cyclic AMP-dependent transcriptional regulator